MYLALARVIASIREANCYWMEPMSNSVVDLLILKKLKVTGNPRVAPSIMPIYWSPPLPGKLKVNTDGSAARAPRRTAGCGGVFRNCT